MDTSFTQASTRGAFRFGGPVRLRLFRLVVILPVLTLLSVGLTTGGFRSVFQDGTAWDVLFWTLTIGVVEFLPVPAWRSLQVSVALPLFVAVAFLYEPALAGAITFLASSDPRELKREVTVLHALFNRSQASLAVMTASGVFHALAGYEIVSLPRVFPVALLAVISDYAVNVTLVAIDSSLMHRVPLGAVLRRFRIGNPMEFGVSYLGLGFLGLLLARLHVVVGAWAVAVFVMPLLLVRQMFFRTRALEDAARALKDREVILRSLSNRMAEERQDERSQIAAYLHDDLAQMLYRMSLHIDISRKHLASGQSGEALDELAAIQETKDGTLQLIRSMIKDLHRSPLGRAGLTEAISSFCDDLEKSSGIEFVLDLHEVEMPPPIQLLCYHVTREAIMNIIKHAEATRVDVTLEPTGEGARVTITDDGVGFDPEQGSPEGHFGLTMMRERAQISGGSFRIESSPGEGSTVVAEFSTAWMSDADHESHRALGLSSSDPA